MSKSFGSEAVLLIHKMQQLDSTRQKFDVYIPCTSAIMSFVRKTCLRRENKGKNVRGKRDGTGRDEQTQCIVGFYLGIFLQKHENKGSPNDQ